MTKNQIENNLNYHLGQRRKLRNAVDQAREELSKLEDEQEDNEAAIRDMRDCLKNGIYS